MNPTPPPSLVRELRQKDEGLRLRWGTHQSVWLIEKKLTVRHPQVERERPNPLGTGPRARDLWDAAKEGYVHVLTIPTSEIHNTPLIMATLHKTDRQVHGSWAALNMHLDALDAAEEKRLDRELDEWAQGRALALHDEIAWGDGRRISMYDPPVAVGEERDGFRVYDRRAVKGIV